MNVLGLNHYNLRANPELLEVLRDFYCSVVGLTQGNRPSFASFGYWLYAGERAILHLSTALPNEPRATHVFTTFDHVAFTCVGREEVEARLKKLNVNFDIDCVPLTGQVQLFFNDPAGNGVELNFSDT